MHERAYWTTNIDLQGLGWDDEAYRTAMEALKYVAKHCNFDGKAKKSVLDYGFRKGSEDIRAEWKKVKAAELSEELVDWVYPSDSYL